MVLPECTTSLSVMPSHARELVPSLGSAVPVPKCGTRRTNLPQNDNATVMVTVGNVKWAMVTVRCNLFLKTKLMMRHQSRSWLVQVQMSIQTVETGKDTRVWSLRHASADCARTTNSTITWCADIQVLRSVHGRPNCSPVRGFVTLTISKHSNRFE